MNIVSTPRTGPWQRPASAAGSHAIRAIVCSTLVALVSLAHAQTSADTSAGSSPPSQQAPGITAPANVPDTSTLTPVQPVGIEALGWLEGCWQGTANRREFREVWLPQRGGMMLGVSQTVMGDKTIDFEYLRLEPRGDAVYYVASPPGKPESAFKLAGESVDKTDEAHIFSFEDPSREFPQKINYRRASEGWLYTEVLGKVGRAERRVIYPMRRVDCESGELIRK